MLQLQYYRPTPLEAAIVDFYRKNHIKSPQDIDLEMFAWDAGIWIHYSSMPTTHIETDHNMYSIIVDNRLPWVLQKVQLAHELGHVLLHAGRQEFLRQDFRVLQEWQADKFAAYALVPTFMIENCSVEESSHEQLVSQLACHFDVPEDIHGWTVATLNNGCKHSPSKHNWPQPSLRITRHTTTVTEITSIPRLSIS